MSSKKRKSVNLWISCQHCTALILQKDCTVHSLHCCQGSDQQNCIRENNIYATADTFLTTDSNLKLIPEAKRSELVLVSHNALQLATIRLGDPVAITYNGITFVKTAWITNDRGLLTASVAKEAADMYLIEKGSKLVISKLAGEIFPAEEITIECLTDLKSQQHSNILNLLSAQCQGQILCMGNIVCYMHFGQKLLFRFTDVKVMQQGLEIHLNPVYYMVVSATKFKFQEDIMQKKENLLSRVGGLDYVIDELKETITLQLNKRSVIPGIHLPSGIILFGPHGTGKTLLMKGVAQACGVHVCEIHCSQIFSKYLGETEKQLRISFQQAKSCAPSVILIDELDTLCPKTSTKSEQEKRIVSALSTLMDELHADNICCVVLAATADINSVDNSLRRPGRFDKELEIHVPNPDQRHDVLIKLLSNVAHQVSEETVRDIALGTHGFVGADLAGLVSKAVLKSWKNNKIISESTLLSCLAEVKPSAMKEVLMEVPAVRWSDIGGQHDLKLKLKQSVEWPLRHADSFKRLGITPPKGLLMFGPPGCSKTMIAKALATESQLNFISVKGPELFSKWVGESEKAVREVFRRARQAAPSIVFFDELDAVGSERGTPSGGSNVQERVLAQLLTELDGVEPLGNVTIVGATNRPDRIDEALLRPGRLDRIIYVPLPDKKARTEIFQLQLSKMPVEHDVDMTLLVDKTEGYSGAEVVAVCHEAALKALEEDFEIKEVSRKHFNIALTAIMPRTSPELLKLYEKYMNK